MPPLFLLHARHEARHIDQGHNRDIEHVAEADEPRGLVRGIDVQRAGFHARIVRDDPDRHALHAREANDNVPRPEAVHFQEIAAVHQPSDDFVDIERFLRVLRDQTRSSPGPA